MIDRHNAAGCDDKPAPRGLVIWCALVLLSFMAALLAAAIRGA